MERETTFAYLVLLGWSALCVYLPFRLRAPWAIAISLVGGVLLLPQRVGWDPPLIPELSGNSLPPLCALIGLAMTRWDQLRRRLPFTGYDAAFALLILAAFGTVVTNSDPLVYPIQVLPGLSKKDFVSLASNVILGLWLPYYLGRVFFRKGEDVYVLFQVIVLAALAYSLLALYELRMSPQLHRMVYGFHQHSFHQTLRGDGFRPMIFMGHGLSVAHFFFLSGLAAFALAKTRLRVGGHPAVAAGAWLAGVLTLLKSVGGLLFGLAAYPLLWITRPRVQLWISAGLALVVAFYYVGRATQLMPVYEAVDLVSRFSEDRADSLRTRMENEDLLLLKALMRPAFGWGSYGRARIFDEEGKDISVTDGYWIIKLGQEGLLGLACRFAAMLGPVWMAVRKRRYWGPRSVALVASLCLFVSLSAFDMLLNAVTVTPLTVLLAGTLAGCVEQARPAPRRTAPPRPQSPDPTRPPRPTRPTVPEPRRHPLLRP